MTVELVQGVTRANVDNLLAARQPSSVVKEPTFFMNSSKLEVILSREKKKVSVSFVCLDLKRPYSVKLAANE